MRNERNLVRHELMGLKVKVVSSRNPSLLKINGCVSYETRNMLYIKTMKGEKKVPKSQATFAFFVPEVGKWVKVEGNILVSRPEDRVKKKFRKW